MKNKKYSMRRDLPTIFEKGSYYCLNGLDLAYLGRDSKKDHLFAILEPSIPEPSVYDVCVVGSGLFITDGKFMRETQNRDYTLGIKRRKLAQSEKKLYQKANKERSNSPISKTFEPKQLQIPQKRITCHDLSLLDLSVDINPIDLE